MKQTELINRYRLIDNYIQIDNELRNKTVKKL